LLRGSCITDEETLALLPPVYPAIAQSGQSIWRY